MAGNRYCSNCGQELGEGARFCSNCGQAITGTAPEAREPEENKLLFEVTSSPFFGGWPRTTILAFHRHVVVRQKPALGRVKETTIRYGQIASVYVMPGLSYADVVVETTGGRWFGLKAFHRQQRRRSATSSTNGSKLQSCFFSHLLTEVPTVNRQSRDPNITESRLGNKPSNKHT